MSIGQTLREARERRQLTVERVAEQTRIRATIIRQIEQDDFHGCGGAVYARGHIRSLARTLDLDPEPLVAGFDRFSGVVVPDTVLSGPVIIPSETDQSAGRHLESPALSVPPHPPRIVPTRPATPAPSVTAAPPMAPPRGTPSRVEPSRGGPSRAARSRILPPRVARRPYRERRMPAAAGGASRSLRWTMIAASCLAIVVLLAVIGLVRGGADHPDPLAAPATQAPATHASAHPGPAVHRPAPVIPTAPAGVVLRVQVNDSSSWLSVVDEAGTMLFSGVLPSGSVKEFHSDTQLRVRFGNAGAVSVTLNGHPVGTAGGQGQSIRRVYNADSVTAGPAAPTGTSPTG